MVELLASLKPFDALQHWMASGSEVAGAIKEFQDQQQWANKATHVIMTKLSTADTEFIKDIRCLVSVMEEFGNIFEEGVRIWSS